jgi:hypothetical protein
MPYMIAKSPFLSFLDDRYSRPRDAAGQLERLKILNELKNANKKVTSAGSLGTPAVASTVGASVRAVIRHIDNEWFGRNNPAAPTTGYWNRWKGDAEGIVREALVRAIEVSVGANHGSAVTSPSRWWPIEFLWTCPHPRFEAWVTWRRQGSGPTEGQVTVLFTTPGVSGRTIERTILSTKPNPGPDYKVDPDDVSGSHGVWVIGHQDMATNYAPKPKGTPMGRWHFPIARHVGVGPVICVAPAEDEGGVLSAGRTWS